MPEINVDDIRATLTEHGQLQLLRFYDRLDDSQKSSLLGQIATIDFEELSELIETHVKQTPDTSIPDDLTPPEIIPCKPSEEQTQALLEDARKRGDQLLREGKVAAFVVAGGQGTRLGYEGPKGCFPATPVTKKSLFQVFAEQILAASRRARKPIPWYVMTSPANDVATRAFFRQKDYFGLNPQDVMFFSQGTMPAMDFEGNVLLSAPDSIALSPNGHGGSLLALRRSGALEDMSERGVELISYFQVDNPLVRAVDPVFLGLHDLQNAEMSAKALPKRDPMEKLGNFCVSDGNTMVIEYSDMPEELAVKTQSDGRLLFSAGSIAIHVLSRSFVERLTAGGRCELPFHRAEKKVPHVDAEGKPVTPREPNAVKLEMFVFDAMPLAGETVIFETDRAEEFSPIKNAQGPDSPATSLHDQVRRAAAWLEEAGVQVPRDADGQVAAAIEISPLYADSAEELAKKVDTGLEIVAGENVYLGSRGQTGGLKK